MILPDLVCKVYAYIRTKLTVLVAHKHRGLYASASIRNFIMHNSNQTVLYLVVPSVFIGSTRALGLADCVSGAKNFYVSVDARSVCGSLPSCFYWPTTRYHVCNLSVTGRKWK